VGGLSGTGKSTLAAALAPGFGPAPGAVNLRSDLERKRLFAVAETFRLPAQSYTPQASAQVYATLMRKARAVLSAGQSVIADAVYAAPEERAAIEAAAAELGVGFQGFWLSAAEETLVARVERRRGDGSERRPWRAAASSSQPEARPAH